jgi:uncharacterized damage-inducible protein DinB
VEAAAGPLRALIDLNTDLILNCLDGLEEADGAARIAAGTNNIAFLVAHVADARFFMAKLLGQSLENPLEAALAGVTSIDEARNLPSLGELRETWAAVSAHVRRCVDAASAAQWSAPSGSQYAFPIDDQTLLGAVAFLVQHESYHLGQISLIRKARGHAAMSYRRDRPSEGKP